MTTTTDIIIIGSGIAGLALACALGRANFNVLLIDSQQAMPPQDAAKDLRVSSITYACHQWLKQLGAQIPMQQCGIFRTMYVWEQQTQHPAELSFDSADLGIPTLGYIIPNQLLMNALQEQLNAMPNVQIERPVQPQALQFTPENIYLTLPDQQIRAKLIIGADGAQSWVREQCQFMLETKSYDHSALVANLKLEKPHQQCAYQRFSGTDILAFLPLANSHECSLVWSGQPARIEELKNLSPAEFEQELQNTWGNSLGKISVTSARPSFPLTMRHAQSYIQDRVALIGDAAHTIHPLAGQGLNLGLWDAQCLAKTIIETQQKRRDYGRYSNLRSYERARRWYNDVMIKTMASNKWIFAQSDPTTSWIRQAGMQLINNIPFIKKKIMKTAVFGE